MCLLMFNKVQSSFTSSSPSIVPSLSENWEEWQTRSVWHSEHRGHTKQRHMGIYHLKTREAYQLAQKEGVWKNNGGKKKDWISGHVGHEKRRWRYRGREKDRARGVEAEHCNDPFLTAEWAFLPCTHTHTPMHILPCNFSLLTTENVNKQFAHPGCKTNCLGWFVLPVGHTHIDTHTLTLWD